MEQTQHDLYWQMQKDSWLFHQKYFSHISDSDEFWEKAIDESNAISKKYGNCKYIINLLLNEICELERICKTRRREKSA